MITKTKNNQVFLLGFYSSMLSTIFVVIFALSLILSFQTPTEMLSFSTSLFLAPCFVVMMVSIHYSVKDEKRIWSHIGVTFSIIYAVMITITYYIQLAVVRSNPLNLSEEVLKPFIYSNVGSVMFAIDMLGYSFMALATLMTAQGFSRNESGLELWVQRLFIFHGLLFIPTILFPLFISPQTTNSSQSEDFFGVIALLFWSIIFILMSGLVTLFFKKKKDDRNS